MAHEVLVKRTIWVSVCRQCGDRDIREDNPPKGRYHCQQWWSYEEESYTGPSLRK